VVIKRKGVKNAPIPIQIDIEDKIGQIIERGGKTTADVAENKAPEEEMQKEFRFTLRGPETLLKEIDRAKKHKIGNVSRNQWILEAIEERLHRVKN
jgi:hypothetical protein